ncbi:MAG: RNA polymerase sigma factor [Candidatus Gracilibacteria bacterium]|jgi:RNA polymerase sigma-70 factor (ECF subfamily)
MKTEKHVLFSTHYRDYFSKIYSFIYYRVNDRAMAEDLASQTFLKGYERYEQFDPSKASFKTWIYKIAQNTLIDHFRTHTAHVDLVYAEEVVAEDNILNTLITQENHERAHKLLKKLSPEQRRLVIMRLWDELSYQEIAAITGKSEASLKMAFVRAMNVLKADSFGLFLLILLTNR